MTDQPMQKCSKCGDMTMLASGSYCLNCGSLIQVIQPSYKDVSMPNTEPSGLVNRGHTEAI